MIVWYGLLAILVVAVLALIYFVYSYIDPWTKPWKILRKLTIVVISLLVLVSLMAAYLAYLVLMGHG